VPSGLPGGPGPETLSQRAGRDRPRRLARYPLRVLSTFAGRNPPAVMVTMSVVESTSDQPDDAAAIMQLVTDAYRSSRAQIDRVLGRFDLSAMQYGLLMRVAQDPDISGAELARRVRVSAQAVQNQLALLEQRSLLIRARDHGKKIKVRITPAGREKLANAQPLVNAVQVGLVEPFDPNDRQLLRELLAAYAASAAHPRDL